jgi:hypothetical protein
LLAAKAATAHAKQLRMKDAMREKAREKPARRQRESGHNELAAPVGAVG